MAQVDYVEEGLYGHYSLTEAGREKIEAAIREQYAQGVKNPEVELDFDCCAVGAGYDYEKEIISAELFFIDMFDEDVSVAESWTFKNFAL